jgi:hypothetical protein
VGGRLFLASAAVAMVMSACGSEEAPSAVIVTSTPESLTTITAAPVTATDAPPAPATSVATTTTPVADTVAPSSTVTTTTVADTTTTTLPTAATMFVGPDTVGPLSFGMGIAPVLDVLVAVLGPTLSDTAHTYPVIGASRYVDEFGDFSFAYPYGRQTCFENEFCVEAGGPSPAELVLVGWSQTDAVGTLRTVDGVSIGTSAADVDGLSLRGGCYSFGYGTAGGIDFDLVSSGEPFTIVGDDGSITSGSPDPADLTVVGMTAGENRTFEYNDC